MVQNIRQAVESDSSAIANLVATADFVHRHLDWTPLLDWISHSPFLLSENENNILTGLLACPPDPTGVTWIKCFGCSKVFGLTDTFKSFLHTIRNKKLLDTGYLYALGLQNWFIKILLENQFIEFQKVIVLQHKGLSTPPSAVETAFVRPMELADIPDVAELDRLSFEPIWVISPQSMKLAFLQSTHASVFESEGKIVGYELSTSAGSSAHLARVAVRPDRQNENIASALIHEMIAYFHRNNIFSISVNTQEENYLSQALYRKMGFILTGEKYPIFQLQI